jgi:membrane-bound lytic murein transglycosylase A
MEILTTLFNSKHFFIKRFSLVRFLLVCSMVLPHVVWGGAVSACDSPSILSLSSSSYPLFDDDQGYELLNGAIDSSIRFLGRLPKEREFVLCGEEYSADWLVESQREFQEIIRNNPSPAILTAIIKEKFTVCQASGRVPDRNIFVTGYYEPLFEARNTKTARFKFPLYKRPSDLIRQKGQPVKIGRRKGKELVPYWTRAQIENENRLAGHELVYLADPVEVFILQVQGSGRVRLADGSVRSVLFAAKNGHQYRSIGRFLVDSGKMDLAEVTMPKIVQYLQSHRGEQDRIMQHNKSFVFFRWGDAKASGPVGSLGEPLTAGRSVAMDHGCFPPGALAYVTTRKPKVNGQGEVVGWTPMSRFVLNHDTGSAIKGPGRLDFFWGRGRYAEVAAGNMKHPGKLFFLIKKK